MGLDMDEAVWENPQPSETDLLCGASVLRGATGQEWGAHLVPTPVPAFFLPSPHCVCMATSAGDPPGSSGQVPLAPCVALPFWSHVPKDSRWWGGQTARLSLLTCSLLTRP